MSKQRERAYVACREIEACAQLVTGTSLNEARMTDVFDADSPILAPLSEVR